MSLTIRMVKHRGVSIVLWGCFSLALIWPLVKIEGITDSSKYYSILAQNLQASVRQPKGRWRQILPFSRIMPQSTNLNQQSNGFKRKIFGMFWSCQSPDHNPFKNLCNETKRGCMKTSPAQFSRSEALTEYCVTLVFTWIFYCYNALKIEKHLAWFIFNFFPPAILTEMCRFLISTVSLFLNYLQR